MSGSNALSHKREVSRKFEFSIISKINALMALINVFNSEPYAKLAGLFSSTVFWSWS